MYYMKYLPFDCSMLLRKVTLGCLPRRTLVQGTFISPLASWNNYLHVTCVTGPELKLKNCGIALSTDPVQYRCLETPRNRIRFSDV